MFKKRAILTTLLIAGILTGQLHFLTTNTAEAAESAKATLVNTIQTSKWSPPSPDPAGITFHGGSLIVADSEVEEMKIYKGVNIYESSRTGSLKSTSDTTSFSKEPTGITVNPSNGHFFISDDGKKKVFEVDPGKDNKIGTNDDSVSSFSTTSFGSSDPEGIAYAGGKLYIADGAGKRIYIVSTSGGGAKHFDVGKYGVADPEGVAYNDSAGTLFILDSKGKNKLVIETTLGGDLVRKIDISASKARRPGGIAYAPATKGGGKNIYIVDRGVDNNKDPNENDGKIYEMAIGSSVVKNNPTPTPTKAPNNAPTPTKSPGGNGSNLVFAPVDDAFINKNSKNRNYGTKAKLTVDGSPSKDILMKFRIDGIGSTSPKSAILRLHNTNASDHGGSLFVTGNSWDEKSVTWKNAPDTKSSLGSIGKVKRGNWYEIDLSSYVTGNGTYSIRITSPSGNSADYISKEGSSSKTPELVLSI